MKFVIGIFRYIKFLVALSILGGAISLFSCSRPGSVETEDTERLMTQQSDSLIMISSENGRKQYRFETPLMEYYGLAKEPFREFRKGIKIETYDSTGRIESTLVASYAIHNEKQDLWTARGNVVATNAKGQKLETQQLFWDRRIKRIYSNVDSKVTQGEDVVIGEGFESDETFTDWEFRRSKGRLLVDVEPTRDTTVHRPGDSSESADGSTTRQLKQPE